MSLVVVVVAPSLRLISDNGVGSIIIIIIDSMVDPRPLLCVGKLVCRCPISDVKKISVKFKDGGCLTSGSGSVGGGCDSVDGSPVVRSKNSSKFTLDASTPSVVSNKSSSSSSPPPPPSSSSSMVLDRDLLWLAW